MGCCTQTKNNQQESKKSCTLCKALGNSIHYLAVEMIVKEELISEVTKEKYFACTNENCDVVFYSEYGNRIFLVQDINMNANFDAVTKSKDYKCKSKCERCNSK